MRARCRVISDNDYAGDPDGLFQLAHLLLSPSVDVRLVIGSHLAAGDPFDPSGHSAAHGSQLALELLDLLGRHDEVPVRPGTEQPLADRHTPQPSPASEAIITEAMRTDSDLPLFATFGGGLTELASAYLQEPRIAERLTAVWIGGPEYPDLALPPPGAGHPEYNLNIDPIAAQRGLRLPDPTVAGPERLLPAGPGKPRRTARPRGPGRTAGCLPIPQAVRGAPYPRQATASVKRTSSATTRWYC